MIFIKEIKINFLLFYQIFSTLKIVFTSLVQIFSYSYNNYELVKYINKNMNQIKY